MFDLEKKIKNSKKAIEESAKCNPKQLYEYTKKNDKKRITNFHANKFVLAIPKLVLTCVLFLAIFLLISNTIESIDTIEPNKSTNIDKEFKQFETTEELKKYIQNNNYVSSDTSFKEDVDGGKGDSMSDPLYGATATSPNVSIDYNYSTNTQVKNVEESDIVKVNGDYIYYIPKKGIFDITEDYLYVLKKNGDNLDIIKKVAFGTVVTEIERTSEESVNNSTTSRAQQLYVTDKYIIVQCYVYERTSIKIFESNSTKYCDYKNYSAYYIYDINTYEEVKTIKTPGRNVSTRLINNNLYIVNNYYQYSNFNEDLMPPSYYINDTMIIAPLNRIFYCPYFGTGVNSYVIVFKVELLDDIKVTDLYFLSPYIKNIYATENTIYLINNNNNHSDEKQKQYISTYSMSKIVTINIEDELRLENTISVKGNITDKYWIDEYNGYLRIATTGDKSNYKVVLDKYKYYINSTKFNYITIFKKDANQNWQEINCITEGIGKEGESIRSVRFNKEIATVVTFRQTDPLYYIDLTNPTFPEITSQLEVSGYTAYQHPYQDSYVIGFGYEASMSGVLTGYKISLFDIRDKLNIKEVGRPIQCSYSDGFYNLEVINDPKSLMLDLKNDLFGFGMMKRNDASHSVYYVCKIDVTEDEPIKVYFQKESTYNNPLDRMVYIGDTYYLLSRETVFIYKDVNNAFNEISQLELKNKSNQVI